MKKRIALINQRYGLEVNGGAEYYTRLIAERLNKKYDVEVLTTRAVDYITWANYYKKGLQDVNGVKVRRFGVKHPRRKKKMDKLFYSLFIDAASSPNSKLEKAFIEEQGPLSKSLINYISLHRDDYDVFIFITYLYYPTVFGLPIVSDKAIFIPTAHDEPFINIDIFKQIFTMPKALIFLTDEEEKLVHDKFGIQDIPYDVMGVGVDIPPVVNPFAIKEKYGFDDYIIYVGRIDESKGCTWLYKYFKEYKERNTNDLKLIFVGKSITELKPDADILNLGFVSEQDKFNFISGAKALVLPSQFESLSIAVLESLSLGVPIIVNGRCEVLKGHCIKSDAGLYYNNFFEFEGALNYMLEHPDIYSQMKKNALDYISEHYTWDVIMNKFEKIIDKI